MLEALHTQNASRNQRSCKPMYVTGIYYFEVKCVLPLEDNAFTSCSMGKQGGTIINVEEINTTCLTVYVRGNKNRSKGINLSVL
jgi:hypothetical protein